MRQEERHFFALKAPKFHAGQKPFLTARAFAYNKIDCRYLLLKKKMASSYTSQLIFFNDLWRFSEKMLFLQEELIC